MIYKRCSKCSCLGFRRGIRENKIKMVSSTSFAVSALCLGTAFAGSIKDIKHVVLFMQENRAFDHVGVLRIPPK